MLKWTVNKRLSVAQADGCSADPLENRQRHLLPDGGHLTTTTTPLLSRLGVDAASAEASSTSVKRRRSEAVVTRRRSASSAAVSCSRHRAAHHRRSLCRLDRGKENDILTGGCSTSTPIKSVGVAGVTFEAFRDVSNLTPTMTADLRPRTVGRRSSLLSLKKCRSDSKVQSQHKKRKKQCLDPSVHAYKPLLLASPDSRFGTNCFTPFEAVDSHITSKNVDDLYWGGWEGYTEQKRFVPTKNHTPNANYASTLPTFAMEYSPCLLKNSNKSPANIPSVAPVYSIDRHPANAYPPSKRSRIDHVNDFLQQISFLPTAINHHRFPGLQINNNNKQQFFSGAKVSPLVKKLINFKFNNNDSSFINDMSLDKIVNAILDTSSNNNEADSTGTSVLVHADTDLLQRDNELNETQEDNIINAAHERLSNSTFSDKNSSDSGFRSSTTEQLHDIDSNFMCKCTQGDPMLVVDKTIINVDGTFNERCVDVTRKRTMPDQHLDYSSGGKRQHLDLEENFTLKRQRCVRRKRPVEQLDENTFTLSSNRNSCLQLNAITRTSEDLSTENSSSPYNDNSFDSSCDQQVTLRIVKPENNKQRTRRCLLFESPKNTIVSVDKPLGNSSTPNKDEMFDLGHLDLAIRFDKEKITLYVHQCYNLPMVHGLPVNAYIKVAIKDRHLRRDRDPQRTAVQPESCSPSFHHEFIVPVPAAALQPQLLIEVWHRDRINRRSDFLGCMSFEASSANENTINGSYRLLPQSSGRSCHIPLVTDPYHNATNTIRIEGPSTTSTVLQGISSTPPAHQARTQRRPCLPLGHNMCESIQSSVDEVISFDDIDNELLRNKAGGSISSSKAALTQHQRDADENLFLRYLELDPTEGPDAIPAATQRKALGARSSGRTPFTTTRTLLRPPKSGFGFSVVWTNPPRIERVEKGLPADRAGVVSGDYIIFVDKHNVVMMPEMDILNLIRSFGNQLSLEIYRKPNTRNGSAATSGITTTNAAAAAASAVHFSPVAGGATRPSSVSSAFGLPALIMLPPFAAPSSTCTRRPSSTVCSTITNTAASVQDYGVGGGQRPDTAASGAAPSSSATAAPAVVPRVRRPLPLPHIVSFSTEKHTNADDARRKAMYQLIHKEQQYVIAMQFAVSRFVTALQDRKDLITQVEHRTLFQNSDEILRLSEGILEHLISDDGDYQTQNILRIYHCKLSEIGSIYKRYCAGIKKADCVLANKTKNSNSDFAEFLQNPEIPRRRPDITVFIHKPLQHLREVLKLFHVMLSNTKSNYDDYPVISQIVHSLQTIYREMTTEAGLMEPVGEGKPLLSVQDLENRLVFTKCKPFVLSKPGRQWIFGGDLSRVEGRNVRQYWTLLFSDILLFAKVSRDRVLFILEDPLPLTHISELCFNVRKKANEFRILVEPNACKAVSSPTVHCGPDLSRTPRKNPGKKCIILRAPTIELKAVWQNLLQRQIFHINAPGGVTRGDYGGSGGVGGSSFSSTPMDSPLGCDDATDHVMPMINATTSATTLLQHSAESLSMTTAAAAVMSRRQVRLMTNTNTSSCGLQPYQHHPVVVGSCSSSIAHQLHTPETPSANITRNSSTRSASASSSSSSSSSSTSSMNSQAFTSHFNSETSLLLPQSSPPSAVLTPSTDASVPTARGAANLALLSDEPWDLTNFEYEFTLNIDDYFK